MTLTFTKPIDIATAAQRHELAKAQLLAHEIDTGTYLAVRREYEEAVMLNHEERRRAQAAKS